jgi:ATP-dependent protease HslVU (ClpYQ) peptidase subunit
MLSLDGEALIGAAFGGTLDELRAVLPHERLTAVFAGAIDDFMPLPEDWEEVASDAPAAFTAPSSEWRAWVANEYLRRLSAYMQRAADARAVDRDTFGHELP